MRYTLATGEPVFTGFMRTRPSSTLWAWVYAHPLLPSDRLAGAGGQCRRRHLLPRCAPPRGCRGRGRARTSSARGPFLPVPPSSWSAEGSSARSRSSTGCWSPASSRASWSLRSSMCRAQPGSPRRWGSPALTPSPVPSTSAGRRGLRTDCARWSATPEPAASPTSFSPTGRATRDTGWARAPVTSRLPSAATRFTSRTPASCSRRIAEAMRRWHGWWRIVRADQWGVFFIGAILGMALPALLYVTFIPRGTDIRGLGISAALASSIGAEAGPLLGGVIAFLGAWILFKTQLDLLEGMVRAITDILWTGQQAGPRLARRRRPRRLLHRPRGRRRVGNDRAAARTSRSRCCSSRRTSAASCSWWRRCTFSTSTPGCCRSNCARHCGAALPWWRCRCSMDSSCRSRSGASGDKLRPMRTTTVR